MTCGLIDLGLTPYEEGLALQRRLAALRVEGRVGDLLLLLEHPPVVTLGRGGEHAHLLVPESSLAARGIEFFNVERGGDITYHGPGQLVGYPILDLNGYRRDVHSYLRKLEWVLVETLTRFGLDASRWVGRTGVWVRGRKIASIGIHVSRWVTRHGFAMNVDVNLDPFDLIIPCGIKGARATSIANELCRPVAVEEVIPVLVRRFEANLGVDLLPITRDAIVGATGWTHQGVRPMYPPPVAHATAPSTVFSPS